jgi:antitoxin MazE
MNIQISKWGNSLALRIPAAFIKEIKLKDGDRVEATLTSEGALVIKPQKLDRKEIAELIKKVRGSMKMSTSVMDEVRAEGPY